MRKSLITLGLVCICTSIWVNADPSASAATENVVVQWNRALLTIVRTPNAQPPTVHPTRSFAIMHVAMYDAVNSIDRSHEPYLVRIADARRNDSEDAAAASAAHDVLIALYPTFQSMLDSLLQTSLTQITDGSDVTEGVRPSMTRNTSMTSGGQSRPSVPLTPTAIPKP